MSAGPSLVTLELTGSEISALLDWHRDRRLADRDLESIGALEGALCELSRPKPQMVNDLKAWLASRFEERLGLPMVWAQTGEEYAMFTHAGPKREGYHPDPISVPTREEAELGLCRAVLAYAEGKTGHLYWRHMPPIGIDIRDEGGWTAYTRLLISDKPTIWRTMAEYEADRKAAA